MRRKTGIVLMMLGIAMILAAAGFFTFNKIEDKKAGEASEEILTKLKEELKTEEAETKHAESDIHKKMKVVMIDGHGYIGYLSMPAIDRELPVMADWNYEKLKLAPCRYHGSIFTDNLVIAGHRYSRHFSYIEDMPVGSKVFFTDMKKNVTEYEVTGIETTAPEQVELMTDGQADLTLFTCTYGGRERIAVRCDRKIRIPIL